MGYERKGKGETVKKLTLVTLTGVLAMALVCGCGTSAKGPTDQELINKVVADWKAAGIAKDLDKMLGLYSESFQHYEWGDKAGLKNFLKDAISMGYLDNAELATDKAKITIEKGQAKVAPIEMKAAFGSATIELVLKKEGKTWMIVGMEVEQH
jgi:hypothetical protein